MINSKISILLVDDHAIVVDGCSTLLKQNGFKSIAVATSCEEGLQLFIKNKPALVIVDISMPGIGGLGLIRRIRKKNIDTKIIVFSMHDDPSIVSRALKAGVEGYISKTNSPETIIEAIDLVLSGNVYLSHDIAQNLALDKLSPEKNKLNLLTPREYEIFDMLVNGSNVSQIAGTLHLTSKSVSNYVTKIKAKLNIKNIAGLIHLGYQFNITKKDLELSL